VRFAGIFKVMSYKLQVASLNFSPYPFLGLQTEKKRPF
jgi:hypothetical protein